MKILLTGIPKSGKSTMLAHVIAHEPSVEGFLTQEVTVDGRRVAFRVIDSVGRNMLLATRTTNDESSDTVGSFSVNVDEFSRFVEDWSITSPSSMVYLDEIGQMQLLSPQFRTAIDAIFSADNDFIGTISAVYADPLISTLLNDGSIFVVPIDPEHRQLITDCVASALSNRQLFNRLNESQQRQVIVQLRAYIASGAYISFQKFFNNTLGYYFEKKIEVHTDGTASVDGKHSRHTLVRNTSNQWQCDCPLSNGMPPYVTPQECSHIQAVKLFGLPS